MCLAIPGEIISISGADTPFPQAKVSFGGILKDVSLACTPEAQVGQYVLVHVGMALSVLDQEEAHKTLEYLKELGELEELQDGAS